MKKIGWAFWGKSLDDRFLLKKFHKIHVWVITSNWNLKVFIQRSLSKKLCQLLYSTYSKTTKIRSAMYIVISSLPARTLMKLSLLWKLKKMKELLSRDLYLKWLAMNSPLKLQQVTALKPQSNSKLHSQVILKS